MHSSQAVARCYCATLAGVPGLRMILSHPLVHIYVLILTRNLQIFYAARCSFCVYGVPLGSTVVALVQRVHLRHVLRAQGKIVDVGVLVDALRPRGLG